MRQGRPTTDDSSVRRIYACGYVLEGQSVWFDLVVATCLKGTVFGLNWLWVCA